jgi:hypothetical protein
MWFIFSIVSGGPWNGWAQISLMKGMGFSIFLSILESILYTAACGLGVFNILRSIKLEGEEPCKGDQNADNVTDHNELNHV